MSDQATTTVVIVGGGFAGLSAAKAPKKAPVRVLLIDRTNRHLLQPLLYLASGRRGSTGADRQGRIEDGRTRQMVTVSQELLALRGESRRVVAELIANGGALGSQAKESAALELEAEAALLQSQLDYVQAADEMDAAVGRRLR
jgi:NADH dehydrogenase FAD-containing subunit